MALGDEPLSHREAQDGVQPGGIRQPEETEHGPSGSAVHSHAPRQGGFRLAHLGTHVELPRPIRRRSIAAGAP